MPSGAYIKRCRTEQSGLKSSYAFATRITTNGVGKFLLTSSVSFLADELLPNSLGLTCRLLDLLFVVPLVGFSNIC